MRILLLCLLAACGSPPLSPPDGPSPRLQIRGYVADDGTVYPGSAGPVGSGTSVKMTMYDTELGIPCGPYAVGGGSVYCIPEYRNVEYIDANCRQAVSPALPTLKYLLGSSGQVYSVGTSELLRTQLWSGIGGACTALTLPAEVWRLVFPVKVDVFATMAQTP